MHLNYNNLKIGRSISFCLLLLFVTLLNSCQSPDRANKQDQVKKPGEETLIRVNKNLVKNEEQKIRDFINRYDWTMEKTESGLFYLIYDTGHGKPVGKNRAVTIRYSVSLLNGHTVYASRKTGPLTFLPGKGEVPKGLDEGILKLKEGDRAKFIIPSHLAYGLVGDAQEIPAKATLVYDVLVIKVK